MSASPAELLSLARETAVAAGELVRRRRAEGVEVAALKSSPVDVVTAADREAEVFITEALLAARPDDGILGEEGASREGTSGLTWVVDPIDGTVNYLYGIPHYAVSIAVVEGTPEPTKWNALAGAVVNPATGEVFTASLGGGAWLGERPLRVNDGIDLSVALLATGFSYSAEQRDVQAALVATLVGKVRDIRRMGSSALDLCGLAAGRIDCYYERGLHPWDHAAGALIAREAGARVTITADPRPLVTAAAPSIYAQLAPLIATA